MKSTRLRISVIWLSILAYFVVPLGGTEALVLCFGADGHIEVETAPCCLNCTQPSNITPKSFSCNHFLMGDALSNGDHSSCVDIPLLNDLLNQSISTDQNGSLLIRLILLTPFPFFLPASARFVVRGLPVKPLTDNNPTLAVTRSVILLI